MHSPSKHHSPEIHDLYISVDRIVDPHMFKGIFSQVLLL